MEKTSLEAGRPVVVQEQTAALGRCSARYEFNRVLSLCHMWQGKRIKIGGDVIDTFGCLHSKGLSG